MDVVGRYGGEEFMILLPDTDDRGVVSVADSVMENIRSISVKPSLTAMQSNSRSVQALCA